MKLTIPRWRKELSTLVVRVLGNRNSENRIRPQSTRLNAERLEDRLSLSASHPLPWIDSPGHVRKLQKIDVRLSQPGVETNPAPTPDAESIQAPWDGPIPVVDLNRQTWNVPTRPTMTTKHSETTIQSGTISVRRYVVNPAIVKATGKFPVEALMPKTYGFDEVFFEPGDYSAVVFNPIESAKYIGTRDSKMGNGTIGAAGSTFEGFHWAGYLSVRPIYVNGAYQPCNNITFKNGLHTGANAQPIRVRFGATDIIIEDSQFIRSGSIPTGDVVAIYTSDHTPATPCKITIRRNLFVDYTDGVQFGNRLATDFGLNAGSIIEDNMFLISDSRHNANGTMTPGLENALDFKSGGTVADPVIVRRNKIIGYRPVILAGAGTPGYAVTTHVCASNITFQQNEYIDCESVYFLTNRADVGLVFEDEMWVDIKNHGATTPWTERQGSIIAGIGTGTWNDCRWVNCDRLEEFPEYPGAPPRVFELSGAVNDADYGQKIVSPALGQDASANALDRE